MKLSNLLMSLIIVFCIISCAHHNKEILLFNIDNIKVEVVKQGHSFYSKQYINNKRTSSKRLSWWMDCPISNISLYSATKHENIWVVVYTLKSTDNNKEIASMQLTLHINDQGIVTDIDNPSDPSRW